MHGSAERILIGRIRSADVQRGDAIVWLEPQEGGELVQMVLDGLGDDFPSSGMTGKDAFVGLQDHVVGSVRVTVIEDSGRDYHKIPGTW
jgi:hypothetical protein